MSDDLKKVVGDILVATARGRHSMLDYINCTIPHKNVESVLLNLIFNFKIICEEEGLRVVGEKCIVFDGSISPPGGTFVLCLDESHISLHCYADEGLIAVDCFTCSKNPQAHMNAMARIKDLMALNFPDGELYKNQSVARFLTPFRKASPHPASESEIENLE
jgi:S-adenosylmethionine/arginine decarboxylase-like enzyme